MRDKYIENMEELKAQKCCLLEEIQKLQRNVQTINNRIIQTIEKELNEIIKEYRKIIPDYSYFNITYETKIKCIFGELIKHKQPYNGKIHLFLDAYPEVVQELENKHRKSSFGGFQVNRFNDDGQTYFVLYTCQFMNEQFLKNVQLNYCEIPNSSL